MQHSLVRYAPLAIIFALFAAYSIPAPAQESSPLPEENESGVFVESVSVQVVNVQAYVTDKKGNPIKGLTKDDFEILEDGRPVKISNFYAAESGRPVTGSDEVESEVAQPIPLPGDDKISLIPEEQRLHLIVYIDNFNLHPANRNKVLRDLRQFLYLNSDRTTRIMLLSYDRSLHLRQAFTSDPGLIASALTELEELSGSATIRTAERRKALEAIEQARDANSALMEAQSHADSVYTEMQFTLRSLRQVVDSLAGLPGRKAILHVSDGIPMTAAEDLFIAAGERFNQMSARTHAFSYDLQPKYRELTAQANAAGVTFYTLDARGLQSFESLSADDGGTVQGGSRVFVDATYKANLQAPLHMMADFTGGKAITNTNAVIPALERISRDFDTYYSLGFQPTSSGDGRYHKIEVKLKKKGMVVRHREGYRSKSTNAAISDSLVSILSYGFERNPMEAELEFDRATPQDNNRFIVPVLVRMPIGKLTFLPRADDFVARVQVAVAVMDEEGDQSPVQLQPAHTIRIPSKDFEQAQTQSYVYELPLLFRPGAHTVAVALRDELSSQVSFVTETLNLGQR